MAAGDKKADSIPPSEKEKDEKKPGADQQVDASVKLLDDAQAKKTVTEAQINSAILAKMSGGNDLLNTTVKRELKTTGNATRDFLENAATGAAHNLADFGKTLLHSVKDPLSVISDVGTVGKAVVQNPSAVGDVVADGWSKLKGDKGAAEAGNAFGNVVATVATLAGGGRGALTKMESKAVAGAGSIEQKIVQTNKMLASVETNATRLETFAVGPAPRLAEMGLQPSLAARVDGLVLKAEKSAVTIGETAVAKLEGRSVTLAESTVAKVETGAAKLEAGTAKIGTKPAVREPGGNFDVPAPKVQPSGTPKHLEPQAPKGHEPKLGEPVREVPIKEQVGKPVKSEGPVAPVKDAPAPIKEGTPVKDAPAPIKEGTPVKDAPAPIKEGTPVKDAPAPIKEGTPVKDGGAHKPADVHPAVADDAAKAKTAGEPGREIKAVKEPAAEPGAKLEPKAEPTAKVGPKTEPGAKLEAKAEPGAKVEPAAKIEPGAKVEPAAKPAKSVADDATNLRKTEPVKPGQVADDAANFNRTEPVKPGTLADDAAKPATESTTKTIAETKLAHEPANKPANFLDDARPKMEPAKPVIETKPVVEPAKPVVEPAQPRVADTTLKNVRTTNPADDLKPSNFVDDARPRTPKDTVTPTPGEPKVVRPDATDFSPSTVNRPILERPIVNQPLPKIDGGGVTPTDRVNINRLSDHLDRMPATTPGVNDVKTNLNNFKLEPSPENYRKFADSVRTLERSTTDNIVVLKEKAEVALEVARQTTLMHSVNYTTQSIERLIQTSQAQVAMLPGGAAIHSQAMDIVSRLQGHARLMVTAETAHAEILAFNRLRGETQQLQNMLSQVKGAQSALENSIKQLEHAQLSLSAANRLVRTGDTLSGQVLDISKQVLHGGMRTVSALLFLDQANKVLNYTAEGIREQLKAEAKAEIEKAEQTEKTQEVQTTQAAQRAAVEEQKSASLYLNSKEIQNQKVDTDNDSHERNRRHNLQYGVTIDDYVYYQKAPGVVAAPEDVRHAVQQNFVRPFRSNVEQQDKTAVQKFDWKKTRFNADGTASRADNPYLSSPIVAFRPAANKSAAKANGSSSDPNHASALIAKNYAFAVGPQQLQNASNRVAVQSPSEAAEQANPDRSTGAPNPANISAGPRVALAAAAATGKNDPSAATQSHPVTSES